MRRMIDSTSRRESQPHRLIQCWEKEFTPSEARRALPYVQRVLADAVVAYDEAKRLREDIVRSNRRPSKRQARLEEQRDVAVAKLNRTIDECNALGLAYVDIPHGRVAFRVTIGGRAASVCWRLGEPVAGSWPGLGCE